MLGLFMLGAGMIVGGMSYTYYKTIKNMQERRFEAYKRLNQAYLDAIEEN